VVPEKVIIDVGSGVEIVVPTRKVVEADENVPETPVAHETTEEEPVLVKVPEIVAAEDMKVNDPKLVTGQLMVA